MPDRKYITPKRGRPPVISEAIFIIMENYIREGITVRDACKKTNISKDAFYGFIINSHKHKTRYLLAVKYFKDNKLKLENDKLRKKIENGVVYIIKIVGQEFYKIGMSTGFRNRMQQLATSMPFELETKFIIKTKDNNKLERKLHEKFIEKRIKGEWFKLNNQDLLYIKNTYGQRENNTSSN